jgi:hypothetical protein
MNSVKSIIAVLAVFMAGLFVGIALDHWYVIQRMEQVQTQGPQVFHKRILQRLNSELSLSKEQYNAVQIIVKNTFEKIHGFHKDTVAPTINGYFTKGQEQIAQLLNTEQKIIFEARKEQFLLPAPRLRGEEDGELPPRDAPPHRRRPGMKGEDMPPFPPPHHGFPHPPPPPDRDFE